MAIPGDTAAPFGDHLPANFDEQAPAGPPVWRWNEHTNDIGDWCPHSGRPITPGDLDYGDEDAQCPAAPTAGPSTTRKRTDRMDNDQQSANRAHRRIRQGFATLATDGTHPVGMFDVINGAKELDRMLSGGNALPAAWSDADGYEPPEARTDAQRALASLPVAVRLRMLDRVVNVMEFGDIDGTGEPGTEWSPDRWQDLDQVFAGVGVTLTSATSEGAGE